MKKILFILVICIIPVTVFAQPIPNQAVIKDGLNEFSGATANLLPSLAMQNDVWADAWIGKIFPSAVPHFGIGFSAGFAPIDTSGVSQAAKELGINTLTKNFYLPTMAINARIGGFFLPFDIGLSFLTLKFDDIYDTPLKMEYFTIGGSLRYAILQDKGAFPNLSLGVGYTYTTMDFGMKNSAYHISMGNAAKIIYLETQLSKQFFVVTPYIGGRVVFLTTKSDWKWGALGVVSDDGNTKKSDTNVQMTAGLAFNILVTQLSLGASYDFMSQIFGFNASLRVKM